MIVACAGTGTEVGKTWAGAEVLRSLASAGVAVAAYKPAQSFAPHEGPTDADLLAAATGQAVAAVCPAHRWYEVPMAPPMAAAALGRPPFSVADLLAEVPPAPGLLWVETAGGVLSPIAEDGDNANLIDALGPDLVVVVADAGLGTIHAVRAAIAPLAAHPVVVFLNRFDPANDLHVLNRDWLAGRYRFDVATSIGDVEARLRVRCAVL